jgi:S-adenosylmethionine:tRNA ribosyltransferase-isomerase
VRASEFDYELPEELIAQNPAEHREQSRLMVVDRRRESIEHRRFLDLPSLLDPRDVLARNNTRVVPARLVGHREATGGKWEGLFLQDHDDGSWEILASTRGHPAPGEMVIVGNGLRLVLEARGEAGRWRVRPLLQETGEPRPPAHSILERHGQVPIPPYIRKGREAEGDRGRYQTIYATSPGSVAAPTAGLHFSESVLQGLADRGIPSIDLTLHVGIGTFRPIEVESIGDHVMHAEWAEVTAEAAEALNERRARGGRIVAVGTTSVRTLETAANAGLIHAFCGPTSLFIRPGHAFQGIDALITNFHLPRSSLLVLVSALAGTALIRRAYQEAIRERYRFFSYGDAMLIL